MVCNAAENLQLQMLPLSLLNFFTFNFAILQYIFLLLPWLEHRRCFLTTSSFWSSKEAISWLGIELPTTLFGLGTSPLSSGIQDHLGPIFFTSMHELLLFSYLAPQMTFERSKPIRNRIVKLNLLYMTILTHQKISVEGSKQKSP